MANRKLNSIKFPDLADTYILDAEKVKYSETDNYPDGSVGKALQEKANTDGYYENMGVGTADNLTTDIKANDQSPYLFRTSGGSVDIGDREYVNGIVGGTVAWNQLAPVKESASTAQGITVTPNGNGKYTITGKSEYDSTLPIALGAFTAIKGHKYLLCGGVSADVGLLLGSASIWSGNRTDSGTSIIASCIDDGTPNLSVSISALYDAQGEVVTPQLSDLTLALGSQIADYVYSLEQATAGSGIAWLKRHGFFNQPYYPYNAGSLESVSGLVSHDTTGFNQWDEEWRNGYYNVDTGVFASYPYQVANKNTIKVLPNTAYYVKAPAEKMRLIWRDANGNAIQILNSFVSGVVTTPDNCVGLDFNVFEAYGGTYKNDICINLAWDGSRNGEYEPYVKHSYPLDSDLTLRGIPKLDSSNNLYYDGDVYEPNGTVTRKYGIVDLGTLTWERKQHAGTGNYYFQSSAIGDAKGDAPSLSVCSKYRMLTNTSYLADLNNYDGFTVYKSAYIRDDAYTDAATFKTAMSGVYLVYELATPTTEQADPYQQVQLVDDFGTEEYVLSSGAFPMPVGHNTDYPINLKAQVEMMPHSPEGNGVYVVQQTSGTNEYVSLAGTDVITGIIARLEALEG